MKKKKIAAAAPATIASLLGVSGAEAEIIHITNSYDVGFSATSGVSWDIDQGGGAEAGWSFSNPFGILGLNPATDGFSVYNGGTNNNLARLTTNEFVSDNANFSPAVGGILSGGILIGGAEFTSGVSGFMGFQFDSEGTPFFGWARVTFFEGASPAAGVTVHEWAYDNTGNAIQVGAVPEPAAAALGLGTLALGAAGLRRMRKDR